ncbi:nitrogen fixation protein NifW [Rhodoferax sp. 4810]|uniref:Nitrogenase-stabilizing/protective protein NifW n=1 Tax=Thiospirillum jenense TaxID=1653858 RepID=A0A839HCX1_9GAMM|nr:nitrogenase-stabilizing/protective protein NifW [Thiospirillum jenense]MBB1076286.1 nitrogen fixation protein NifW [Rhodoferax jenense]MBB1124879.1 nitrogen fixation protein NifW [Thiospirillum jenense]
MSTPDQRNLALTGDDDDEAEELVSAEDFLTHYGVSFDPAVVQVNRLHILQRFHESLAAAEAAGALSGDAPARYSHEAALLRSAYEDFVHSDALTEKVFRVFQRQPPAAVHVSVAELLKSRSE